MARKILVPLDGSGHSLKALDFALSIADRDDDQFVMLTVISDERLPSGLEEYLKAEHINEQPTAAHEKLMMDHVLGEGEKRARAQQISSVEKLVEHGNPARVILDVAQRTEADMIIMGARGLSDLRGLLVGSVAHKVNHLADRTVVTVR